MSSRPARADDIVVVMVPTADDKQALLQDASTPFFTTATARGTTPSCCAWPTSVG